MLLSGQFAPVVYDAKILPWLKNLQNELGITTIYVTHDQVEAMTIADRVVVMNNDKIAQVS